MSVRDFLDWGKKAHHKCGYPISLARVPDWIKRESELSTDINHPLPPDFEVSVWQAAQILLLPSNSKPSPFPLKSLLLGVFFTATKKKYLVQETSAQKCGWMKWVTWFLGLWNCFAGEIWKVWHFGLEKPHKTINRVWWAILWEFWRSVC